MSLFFAKAAGAGILIAALTATAGAGATTRQAPAADEALHDRIVFVLDTSAVSKTYDVQVSVVGGRATLTGTVATTAQRAEAERLAKTVGALRVENHIVVNRDVELRLAGLRSAGKSKAGETITDTWTTNRVRWFFMREEQIRAGDITIDTLNGEVTLTGRVRTESGRRRAVELAGLVEGARRVVDRLVIGR